MMLNPQIEADMTRIGCRVCALDPCYMCQGCVQSNGLKCIHLERWKKKRGIDEDQRRKRHQAVKKHYAKLSPEEREKASQETKLRGGYRPCEAGYRDDGMTCFRDLHCSTQCGGDWWNPATWWCNTSCSGPDMYGKYDDEFKGAFQAIGNFFRNLPSVIMDAFKPDGPLARVFDPNLNGVNEGLRRTGELLKAGLENAFDPEKNGVASAMRKFGADIEKGFEEIGSTLKDAFSKESMERAFGPMVQAFNSFGESMSNYFKDPANILGFVTMCLSTVAGALPAPFGSCLAVLAVATKMIGDACLGKPFDPMDLLDLGTAIISPQAQLAKNIATTAMKAGTIMGKLAKGASMAQKAVVESVKGGVKKMAQMSAKDKAVLAGKTLFKISGKLGTDVRSQNPVESQQTPEQIQYDDQIATDWSAWNDDSDPETVENTANMEAELNKESYDKALQEERDAGTVTGEYKKPRQEAKSAKKEEATRNETDPSLLEMVDRATAKPRSYVVDEKIFFYKNATQAQREEELASSAKAKAEAEQEKALQEARLTAGKTAKQALDDKRWAERQVFKTDNELRKYGLSYEEALERLKLYKEEQDKFKTATGKAPEVDTRPPKSLFGNYKTGGMRLVDEPPPEFMMSDVEDRGQDLFDGYPVLPPILTPTFWHFVKEKFPAIPELKDPENWFPEFDKFWKAYNEQKVNYQKLIDANKVALETRKKMTKEQKDRAYQDWLASDAIKETPAVRGKQIKSLGKQQFLDYIRSMGFTEESWNDYAKQAGLEGLDVEEPPPPLKPTLIKPAIPVSNKEFKIPEADPVEFPNRDSDAMEGGAMSTPLVQPKLEDSMAYFKYKLFQTNPYGSYDDVTIRGEYEKAWETDPQGTLAQINQFKLAKSGGRRRKPRRNSISNFFGLKGGEMDWSAWEEDAVDTESIEKAKTENKEEFKNILDKEAKEELAQELWTSDLPQALQEYLASSPEEKREARGELLGLRQWGAEEYGTPTEEDAWFQAYDSFEKELMEKAPELNDMGEDEQIPKDAFENTDEGKADVVSRAETSKAMKDAQAEEAKQRGLTETYLKEQAEEQAIFDKAKTTFDEEWKLANELDNEDMRKDAIDKFNKNFPEGDRRRLSGSGFSQGHPPTMVLKNLWLGNMKDAQNKAWLKRHKIHKVFNFTPDLPETPGIPTVRCEIEDSDKDQQKMLEKGVGWAEQVMEAMEEGPVLIHCKEGRQRSATIATLIYGLKHGQQLHTILKKLRAKRPFLLEPTPTFKKALKAWFYG